MTDTCLPSKNVSVFKKLRCLNLSETLFPRSKTRSLVDSTLTVTGVISSCTALGMLASSFLDHENVIMIYLLGVIYIAARCGRVTSLFACILSVLAFDLFIVPPLFHLIPTDPQYAFTFAIMIFVAMVMSSLTQQAKGKNLLMRQAELLDLTYDAIIVWNLSDYRITFWNAGAQKMFGLSRDQAVEQSVETLLKGEYSPSLADIVSRVKVDGLWSGDLTYCRADGASISVASRWTVKFDGAGNPENIVEFCTDITERINAEKRVKEFYSTVSHELRTPLTAVIGGISILRNGIIAPESEAGNEMLVLAETQADKLLGLINGMLDLQKIEAGKLELHTCTFVMDTVVETAIADLQIIATSEKKSLIKIGHCDRIVDADPVRIGQVLTNLLANAIKFSQSGGEIGVKTEVDNDRLRVSVIDSGPGIARNQLSKLFCKFQQLDSSDTRQHGGTGLGLAISKAIIEQHGGKIGVESDVDKGSTFWFELPVTNSKVTQSVMVEL